LDLDRLVESPSSPSWSRYLRRLIASEISSVTRYYDRVIHWRPLPDDTRYLFHRVECPSKHILREGEDFPDLRGQKTERSAVLLNGNLNFSF